MTDNCIGSRFRKRKKKTNQCTVIPAIEAEKNDSNDDITSVADIVADDNQKDQNQNNKINPEVLYSNVSKSDVNGSE